MKRTLTEEQKAEIDEAFDLFDAEKSGEVTLHELKVCLKAFGFKVNKQEILKLRAAHDPKASGPTVSQSAFKAIMEYKLCERDPKDELKKAFRLFDTENKGGITVDDLRKVARELGEAVPDDELRAMIEEFDDDQDGRINEEEFLNILAQAET